MSARVKAVFVLVFAAGCAFGVFAGRLFRVEKDKSTFTQQQPEPGANVSSGIQGSTAATSSGRGMVWLHSELHAVNALNRE
jgi:hypothetical protein